MITEAYAPGRHLDLHGAPDHGIALLWHGRGVDGRRWMHPLAERIAAAGVLAISVDWSSESADGGRSDLLTSLRHARELAGRHDLDPDGVVVAGWSLGGTAAASLAVHAKRLGVELGGAVLIAPGDGPRVPDPISGAPLPSPFPPGDGRCGIDLIYGERDTSIPPDLVAGLELRLRTAGWATSLQAVDADHSEVVGARYDEPNERYVPSRTTAALEAAAIAASVVVAAASS